MSIRRLVEIAYGGPVTDAELHAAYPAVEIAIRARSQRRRVMPEDLARFLAARIWQMKNAARNCNSKAADTESTIIVSRRSDECKEKERAS